MRGGVQGGVAVVLCAIVLTFSPDHVVGQSPSPGPFEITDPAGDVQIRGQFGVDPVSLPANIPNPATDPFDLVAMSLVEDAPDQLVVAVALADVAAAGRYQYVWNGGGPEIAVGFGVTDLVRYEVRTTGAIIPSTSTNILGEPDAQWDAAAELCIYVDSGDCNARPARATVSVPASTVTFFVEKSELVNSRGTDASKPVKGLSDELGAHTALRDWRVTSTSFQYLDEMPDAGQPLPEYSLRTTVANTKIAMRASHGQDEAVAVPVNAETSVKFLVANNADARRLINVTAALQGTMGPGWDVRAPESVDVPTGETRTVTVLVSAPAGEEHRAAGELLVKGVSLGHEEEIAMGRIALEAARSLGPNDTKLYFHATEDYSYTPAVRYANIWLNTMRDDPTADMDDRISFYHTSLNLIQEVEVSRLFDMDSLLPQGLELDTSKSIDVAAAFSSAAPAEVTVFAHVFAGNASVAGGETSVTMGPQATAFDWALPIDPAGAALPKGARIGVLVGYRASDPASIAATWGEVGFYPSQSSLTVPVASVALDDSLLRIAGIGLQAEGDREEFGRPGHQVVLPVRVTNGGAEAATVALSVQADPSSWTVKLEPGDRFQIQPGGSIRAAVVVDVPEGAPDGDVAEVSVGMRVEGLPDESVRLFYRLVAASVAPAGSAAEEFQPDQETLDSVVTSSEAAPAGSLAAVVLALAAAVFGHRRHQAPRRNRSMGTQKHRPYRSP